MAVVFGPSSLARVSRDTVGKGVNIVSEASKYLVWETDTRRKLVIGLCKVLLTILKLSNLINPYEYIYLGYGISML